MPPSFLSDRMLRKPDRARTVPEPTSGTNRHGTPRSMAGPSGERTTAVSRCSRRGPTGTTSLPPWASCS